MMFYVCRRGQEMNWEKSSFLDSSGMKNNKTQRRFGIKRKVLDWVSISTSKQAEERKKARKKMTLFWDGIVDASLEAPYVWFSREKETDEWKPLRKEDCRVLNSCSSEETEVSIESGRASANLKTMTISHHFFSYPDRKLYKSIWFVVKNPKGPTLEPVLPFEDACKIEGLYKGTIKSSNALATVKDKSSEEVKLTSEGEFKVVVSRSNGRISLRKKQASGFGAILDKGKLLQRGFGNYDVKGEDIELALGPVKHLIFVVHGVGEALWSSSENIPSLKEEMTRLRESMQKNQIEDWKVACERHKQKKSDNPEPPKPHRIEIIPIEWYDRIHSSSNSLMKSLNSATLKSIPSLRSVANDVVFDVLMYMTPEFCEATLDCVTTQINEKLAKFKSIHPHFTTGENEKFKISIIGHSLGSVIVWDLLSTRKLLLEEEKNGTKKLKPKTSGFSVFEEGDNCRDDEHHTLKRTETWAPSLPKKMTKYIDFEPENTYFVGSPLGCMLTLRGAHEEFDDMISLESPDVENGNSDEEKLQGNSEKTIENPFEDKDYEKDDYSKVKEDQDDAEDVKVEVEDAADSENDKEEKQESLELNAPTPQIDIIIDSDSNSIEKKADDKSTKEKSIDLSGMVSPFTLPTKSLYNIFHPSDPVAYRLEPLLLPRHLNKEDIPAPAVLATESKGVRLHIKAKQFQVGVSKNLDSWFGGSKRNVNEVNMDDHSISKSMKRTSRFLLSEKSLDFPIGGKNKRIDYELQVGLIDNEYLSAVSAHTSYWIHEDMVEFILQHSLYE